jgi:hypothetical protein
MREGLANQGVDAFSQHYSMLTSLMQSILLKIIEAFLLFTGLFAESLSTKSAFARSKNDEPLHFGRRKQIQCSTKQSPIRTFHY